MGLTGFCLWGLWGVSMENIIREDGGMDWLHAWANQMTTIVTFLVCFFSSRICQQEILDLEAFLHVKFFPYLCKLLCWQDWETRATEAHNLVKIHIVEGLEHWST